MVKLIYQKIKLIMSNDVMYLHNIKEKLDEILERQNRKQLVQSCIEFLPTRVELDLRLE